MKIYIALVILCSVLIGCEQQAKPEMTVYDALDYLTTPDHNCNSPIWKSKYCDYARDVYSHANMEVQNNILKDLVIQRLLIKAKDVDCYHQYPEPAVCVAVDIRANEIQMKVVKQLNISTAVPIFDVGSAFIQGKFNRRLNEQQTNQEANKLLLEASESKSI